MGKQKKILLFICLFLLGFIIRYALSTYSDVNELGDVWIYGLMAKAVLQGKWAANCCGKNAGYGLYLAGIYYLFGADNPLAVRIVQIITDLITALILYRVGKNFFSPRGSFYVFLIYVTNPITSSFTGLHLAETLTSFLVAIMALILSSTAFKNNKLVWILYGFVLGLFVFVRYQFTMLALSFIILAAIMYFRKFAKLFFVEMAIIGFLLGSTYSLISYYKNYGVISIVSPYKQTWGGLLAHFYDTARWPEIQGQRPTWEVNDNYNKVYSEYAMVDYNQGVTWPPIERKNRILLFQKLRTDWKQYLFNTARNIVWLWDKYHISEFYDRFYPADSIPIRIYNIFLLIFYFYGIVTFIIRHPRQAFVNPLLGFSLYFFLFITFTISLIDNESRHSLPFYPLLMLWAGQGCNYFQEAIVNIRSSRNTSVNQNKS